MGEIKHSEYARQNGDSNTQWRRPKEDTDIREEVQLGVAGLIVRTRKTRCLTSAAARRMVPHQLLLCTMKGGHTVRKSKEKSKESFVYDQRLEPEGHQRQASRWPE
jgi:hypothetical protein